MLSLDNPNFFNLEGRIRDGRSKEVEEKLLWTLDQHVKDLLGDNAYFIALTTFNRCKATLGCANSSSSDREWYSVAIGKVD